MTSINIDTRMARTVGDDAPNVETIEAIREVEHMKKHLGAVKGYRDVGQMMDELLADA